ncbi:MAG: DUF3822 family protein [Prevotella sp.]|nr:DUF3822 family protein [Prevotella sp.]
MNPTSNIPPRQLTIRAGHSTLSFLTPEQDGTMAFHPYTVKSGMSLSANLREAFKEQPYLQERFTKAVLTVCSPVVLIPKEDYLEIDNFNAETMYGSVLTGHKGEEKLTKELYELDAMALYTVNKDLKMVVSDNCGSVDVTNVMLPVWRHLYKRYYQSSERRKMFAYFHDKSVDICSFEQRRLHFANVFDAQHAHDALYYLLFVWKQLGMNQKTDDLFIIGDMPHRDWLMNRLATYITRVHTVNPVADLNRSPLSQIKGMPFDMML